MNEKFSEEVSNIKERYAKRSSIESLYTFKSYSYILARQKYEREIVKFLSSTYQLSEIETLKVLDVGCGIGKNLLKLLELGFKPENLHGTDLLVERIKKAESILPQNVKLHLSNSIDLNYLDKTFDIVMQNVVFSSILDANFRGQLAKKMWDLTRVGGKIIWYDILYNNPNNKDVVGITKKEIKSLFPNGSFEFKKIILAPPLGRFLCKIHPFFYYVFDFIPLLRTYSFTIITKK